MTWIAVKAGLKKFGSFMRRYGWIFVVAGVLILVLVATGLSAGRSKTFKETVKSLWNVIRGERQAHEAYVTKVDEIRDSEIAAHESAARNAVEAVRAAEEEFALRNEVLNRREKRRIESIAREFDSDPEGTAKKLAEEFGFSFVPGDG